MKNNASIELADKFLYYIRDAAETIDMFGQDYLDEYGYNLPNELIERYTKAKLELDNIQNDIRNIVRLKIERKY